MKSILFVILAFGIARSASPDGPDALSLTIHEGVVTLEAENVTARQILAVWARVGETDIVNADDLSSGPLTLKLDSVPEREALDIILRDAPGYLALRRASYLADASIYDRIVIMATTTAPAAIATGVLPEEQSAALDESATVATDAARLGHLAPSNPSSDFAASSRLGLALSPPPKVSPTTVPSRPQPAVLDQPPSAVPSRPPTTVLGQPPTAVPSRPPTTVPGQPPTPIPGRPPTTVPSQLPTTVPSQVPTTGLSEVPTKVPSQVPTAVPSRPLPPRSDR